MRIATWNVNSLKARLGRVTEWVDSVQPDVLCLQETKLKDETFPGLEIESLGYEWAHHGSGRWNGVAILSKVGIKDVVTGFDDGVDDEPSETRAITANCGGVQVTSVYVPNGRDPEHEMYRWKLQWLERLGSFMQRTAVEAGQPAIVLGDFNVAPQDNDVYDIKAFRDSTHVTSAERLGVRQLEEMGLRDVFREQWPQDRLYTWWDYRAGMFHKHKGMRIDLAFATQDVASRVEFALMDRNARKGEGPSDHAPVIVDVSVS